MIKDISITVKITKEQLKFLKAIKGDNKFETIPQTVRFLIENYWTTK